MPGAIAVILLVLAIPVVVIMTGAIASAIVGEAMYRNGRDTHEGSELLDLPD